jgi:hypothetical protein
MAGEIAQEDRDLDKQQPGVLHAPGDLREFERLA